jgi:hypothetical protein
LFGEPNIRRMISVAFRKMLYKTIDHVQVEFEGFILCQNDQQTKKGRYCQDRKPIQTFLEGGSYIKNITKIQRPS